MILYTSINASCATKTQVLSGHKVVWHLVHGSLMVADPDLKGISVDYKSYTPDGILDELGNPYGPDSQALHACMC